MDLGNLQLKYFLKKSCSSPSIKKSLKARTTGRIKRLLKSSVNPIYGRKGVGFVKNPEKSIKNSVYHKVTVDVAKPSKDKINGINPFDNKEGKNIKEERKTNKMSGKAVAGIIGGITGLAIIGAGLSGSRENVVNNVTNANSITTSYVSEANITTDSGENFTEEEVTTQPTPSNTPSTAPSQNVSQPTTIQRDVVSEVQETKQEWVLNTNTKKFHYPYCKSVNQMKSSNKKVVTDTRDGIIKQGYSPCGNCKP